MKSPGRRGNPTLRRWGGYVMILGGACFVVPLVMHRDLFAGSHETWSMVYRFLHWQEAAAVLLLVGNTMRLVGAQGHPGLPFVGRLPHDIVAGIQLRRRAWDNRIAALAGDLAPPILWRAPWNWRVRVAARQQSRRRGWPLPTCLRIAAFAATN